MERKFETLKKAARELRLDPQEKNRIRNVLVSHIQTSNAIGASRQGLFAGLFLNPKLRFALVSLVLLLFLGGATAFAAEGALPGDLLYPVKTQATERVRAFVLSTPQEKAGWAVQLAERRLAEAEELVFLGLFEEKRQRIVQEQLAFHINQATALSRQLSQTEKPATAADLDSDMEGVLRAHALLITRLETPEEDQEHVQRFGAALSEHVVQIEQQRMESELRIVVNQEASGLSKAAQQKQQQARAEVEGVSEILNRVEQIQNQQVERVAEARKTIKEAQQLLREGEQELEEQAFANAFVKFQGVSRVAKEAEVLLQTQLRIKPFEQEQQEPAQEEMNQQEEENNGGEEQENGAEKNQEPGQENSGEQGNGDNDTEKEKGQKPSDLSLPDNAKERGPQGPPLEDLPLPDESDSLL